MSKEQIEHLLHLEADLSELEVETFEIEDIVDPGQVAAVATSPGGGSGYSYPPSTSCSTCSMNTSTFGTSQS